MGNSKSLEAPAYRGIDCLFTLSIHSFIHSFFFACWYFCTHSLLSVLLAFLDAHDPNPLSSSFLPLILEASTHLVHPDETTVLVSQPSPSTASAVAPPLFRASPIDPTYRPPSTPLKEPGLEEYSTRRREGERPHSPLPQSAYYGKDISRPSSTTLPSSSHLFLHEPQFHTRSASLSLGRGYHSEPRPNLPGLSSLTSLANGPPLRYAGRTETLQRK